MGGLTARYLAFSLAPPSPNIMARARFILAVLVSASFVSLAAGGSTGGESRGRSDCGESSTWTIAAGDTKHCCTSISMNYVDKFEYTTEPVGLFSGSSNIKFSVRESENWVTLGEWTVADADCALDGSAQTCTGSACVVPGSSSDGTCKKEVDISSHDKEDICVVANCTGSSTCTHKVEIMFHHNHFECDDCPPAPSPSGNAACMCSDNKFYGDCGGLSTRNDDNWCTEPGWDTSFWQESEFCCAATSDDCCKSDDGAVAGLVIGLFAGFTLCCVACCYCCKCCCFKYRQNKNPPVVMYIPQPGVQMQQMSYPQGTCPEQNPPAVMYIPQPGVQMQQMSYPQGTFPQQGYAPGEIVVAAPAHPTTQIQFADGTTLTPEQGQAKV